MIIDNAIETGSLSDFNGETILRILNGSSSQANVVMATFSGDSAQLLAYYGILDDVQILRENTTLEIAQEKELTLNSDEGVATNNGDQILAIEGSDQEPQPTIQDDHYTNLRQALEHLQQFENQSIAQLSVAQTPDAPAQIINEIDQQFKDVMTYHQERQNDLREALMR
jgi:hypothetical protein